MAFPLWQSPPFVFGFLFSCLAAIILQFLTFECTRITSALTTSVMGVMKVNWLAMSTRSKQSNYSISKKSQYCRRDCEVNAVNHRRHLSEQGYCRSLAAACLLSVKYVILASFYLNPFFQNTVVTYGGMFVGGDYVYTFISFLGVTIR